MFQNKLICISLLLQIFNMSHEDSWQEIITSIKQYGKNGYKKKYNEKYICGFFTIWNFKCTITCKWRQVALSRTSVYFAISKLALSFSYSSHVPCIILYNVYFCIVRSIFFFFFNRSQSEAGVVNQMIHLSFRRRSTIDQLNVPTTTAEKEKLYTLSNIIYIKF